MKTYDPLMILQASSAEFPPTGGFTDRPKQRPEGLRVALCLAGQVGVGAEGDDATSAQLNLDCPLSPIHQSHFVTWAPEPADGDLEPRGNNGTACLGIRVHTLYSSYWIIDGLEIPEMVNVFWENPFSLCRAGLSGPTNHSSRAFPASPAFRTLLRANWVRRSGAIH
jgi:hypothetical protein